jgi:hypothetical protein
MHSFYTYAHARKTDGRIFYIGKGQDKRAYSESNRNRYWRNVVAKHGHTVQILREWNSEKEAFDHEVRMITQYRSMGYALVNMTNGGEGVSGYVFTQEQTAKHTQRMLDAWADVEYKTRVSKTIREVWADQAIRHKHSETLRVSWEMPGRKEVAAKNMRDRWAAPQYRSKMTSLSHSLWESEDYRAKVSAGLQTAYENTDFRQRVSISSKATWAKPGHKTKMAALLRSSWANSDRRQKFVASMAQKWDDPAYRERVSISIAEAYASPEARLRLGKNTSGSRWVNNGIESKRVKPDTPVPEGFVLGRLPRKKV